MYSLLWMNFATELKMAYFVLQYSFFVTISTQRGLSAWTPPFIFFTHLKHSTTHISSILNPKTARQRQTKLVQDTSNDTVDETTKYASYWYGLTQKHKKKCVTSELQRRTPIQARWWWWPWDVMKVFRLTSKCWAIWLKPSLWRQYEWMVVFPWYYCFAALHYLDRCNMWCVYWGKELFKRLWLLGLGVRVKAEGECEAADKECLTLGENFTHFKHFSTFFMRSFFL